MTSESLQDSFGSNRDTTSTSPAPTAVIASSATMETTQSAATAMTDSDSSMEETDAPVRGIVDIVETVKCVEGVFGAGQPWRPVPSSSILPTPPESPLQEQGSILLQAALSDKCNGLSPRSQGLLNTSPLPSQEEPSWPWAKSELWFPFPNARWIVPPTHVIVTDVGIVPKYMSFYWLVRGHHVWQRDWKAQTLKTVLDEMNPGGWMRPEDITLAAWQNVPRRLWWNPHNAAAVDYPQSVLACQPRLASQKDVGEC